MSLPKITLHWLEITRCHRTLFLLEELGLKYTVIPHDKKGLVNAPKSLYGVHPLGKGPVIELDYGSEKDKVVLAESGHIQNYMIKWFDEQKALLPETEQGEIDYDYFLHFTEASPQPPITINFFLPRLMKQSPQLPKSFTDNYQQVQDYINEVYTLPKEREFLQYMESILAKQKEKYSTVTPYFVENKFTGADLMLSFIVAIMFTDPTYASITKEEDIPLITKWFKYAVMDRPAHAKAMEVEQAIIESGYKVYERV